MLSGFVPGQGAAVTQNAGTYAAANVGLEGVNASLANTDFSPGSGTVLSNYSLPVAASGTGLINQAMQAITGVSAENKIFDGSRTDKLNTSNATLHGVVSGTNVMLSTAGAAGRFASSGVGNHVPVTASGFTISGPDAANYTLLQPSGLTADIAPSTLTAAIIGNLASCFGIGAAAEHTVAAAIAGVTPVIGIPFPAPSGLSTRAGNIFASLPVIIAGTNQEKSISADTDTLSSNQPLIVSPEEILLQGVKDKVWHITLPSCAPLADTSKLHP